MRYIGYIFLLLVFYSCENNRCLKSIGPQITETRDLAKFQKINISDKINLFLHTDSTYRAEIIAGENLAKHIETEVSGDWLIVEDKNTCDFLRSYDHKIDVHVYLPDLVEVECSNAGNIIAVDTIKTRTFKFDQWAASGVNSLLLKTDTAYLKQHTGTGDLKAIGTTGRLYVYASSYGQADYSELGANSGWIENRSSKTVYVRILKRASLFLSGHGDIVVSGNPNNLIDSISGSGVVIID